MGVFWRMEVEVVGTDEQEVWNDGMWREVPCFEENAVMGFRDEAAWRWIAFDWDAELGEDVCVECRSQDQESHASDRD